MLQLAGLVFARTKPRKLKRAPQRKSYNTMNVAQPIEWTSKGVVILDQRRLPGEVIHHTYTDYRDVAAAIARMSGSDAQVRALDTLAHYRLSDRESLEELTRLFPVTKSVNVQRAIAGILIRSDYQTIAKPKLVQTLREHRLKSPDGEDSIDVLIRQLGRHDPPTAERKG